MTDHDAQFRHYLNEEIHIAKMIRKRIDTYGDKTAMRDKTTGVWMKISWRSFGEKIDSVAKGLLSYGVNTGDMIGIFSQNRAEWTIADIGILTIRGVSVPVYATNSTEETEYIVNDAGIRILFVNDQDQYNKAMAIMERNTILERVIVFDSTVTLKPDSRSLYFNDFLEVGTVSETKDLLDERLNDATSGDLYTLIYTSNRLLPWEKGKNTYQQ